MDARHCQGKVGFTESPPRSDISVFRAPGGKDADGQIQLPPLSKFSPPMHLPLDLSVWLWPLCQEAFCNRMPSVAQEWQGCVRGMAATAATDTFQSSLSQPLPSREADKRAAVTAWGSNQIIILSLGEKNIQPLSSASGGGSLRKPEL